MGVYLTKQYRIMRIKELLFESLSDQKYKAELYSLLHPEKPVLFIEIGVAWGDKYRQYNFWKNGRRLFHENKFSKSTKIDIRDIKNLRTEAKHFLKKEDRNEKKSKRKEAANG